MLQYQVNRLLIKCNIGIEEASIYALRLMREADTDPTVKRRI